MTEDAMLGLRQRYIRSLTSYVMQPNSLALDAAHEIGHEAMAADLGGFTSETALNDAYEVGRAAISAGVGVLEMAALHHEALHLLSSTVSAGTDWQTYLRRAGEFLAESLSAFEIMLRGYRESNNRLLALNEALAEAKQQADAASHAKGMFVAMVSHEIRTPMNGVIGMLDVLAHTPLTTEQADAVNTMRDSGFALLSVIDGILDFSKIEANRLELERTPVSVEDMVESLCTALVPLAAEKGVDLFPFVSPDLPGWIWSDPTRLRQVLSNLVSNAIKFSGGRPKLRGRVAVRVDSLKGPRAALRLSVTDNGIGMAPEVVDRLFDAPFTQAERTTTRRFGGTGLGLVISKRLIDLMGGEIRATSQPGFGSTLTITLPVETAEGARPNLAALVGVDAVIIPDSDFNAEDLRAYLEPAGAGIQLAADMDDAMRRARRLKLPLIIQTAGLDPAHSAAMAHALAPEFRHLLISRSLHPQATVSGVTIMAGAALRRWQLLRAVALAAGLQAAVIGDEPAPSVIKTHPLKPPSVEEARAAGRLILVAEDDATNQKVIRQELGLLGYAVEIAGDGREALQMWRSGGYALLLSDLHMPEMDGYELAETIRREEGGRPRMPILALTANAMREEASRVFAIGMDEYLTKPMQLHQLQTVLSKWLPPTPPNIPQPPATEAASLTGTSGAINLDSLKRLTGNNSQILHDLTAQYLETLRKMSVALRTAFGKGDPHDVAVAAHTLKAPSRSFGAEALANLCTELERAGFGADRATLEQLMQGFDAMVEAVETALIEQIGRLVSPTADKQ